jgi:hypothetical protein
MSKSLQKILMDGVQSREVRARQGKVISIQTGPPRTLTVEIDGTNFSNIRLADHVHPVVNEGVWILDLGPGSMLAVATNSSAQTRARYVLATGDTTAEIDAGRLTSGTVPSARLSGAYTGITGFGTKTTNFNGYPRMIADAGSSGAFNGLGGSALEIYQATVGTDSFVSFHVAGDVAAHFGMDGAANDFFVGGWSFGANKYRVAHAGNSWRRVERLSASCSASLTLTTTPQQITGPTVTFNGCKTGDEIMIRAVFDFNITAVGAPAAVAVGYCYVNSGGLGPQAIYTAPTATARATVSAQWAYVVPSDGNYTVDLRASKNQNTGTIEAMQTHTTIVAERYSKA